MPIRRNRNQSRRRATGEAQAETPTPETQAAASVAEVTPAPALPKLAYSAHETAEILGVDYFTVLKLIKRGLLRSSNALRHKLIPHAEIERFLRVTVQ